MQQEEEHRRNLNEIPKEKEYFSLNFFYGLVK